jgi:putative transposase
MTNETVSIQKLYEISGISVRVLQMRASKENWQYVEIPGKGRGGKVRRYIVSTLPEDIRLRYNKVQIDSLPVPSAPTPTLPVARPEAPPLESLTERQRARASAKADLLMHYARALKTAGYGSKVAARDSFIGAYNSGRAFPALYAVLGELSWKTIEGWKRILRKGGDLSELADARGAWKRGKSIITAQQAVLLAQCALHPNAWLPSEVIREAKKRMAAVGIQNGHSAATYYRWLNDFRAHNDAIWCWSRGGKKQWNDECCLSIDRDPALIEVGDVLVADGHKLNFEILSPWTGKPQRMTLIVFYDMRSNFPCGWEIMPTEDTVAISAALRRAILVLGKIPKVVYLDNGKAFKSKYFTGTDLEQAGLYGLYAQLGIHTVFAWAYHGQSKTVERFFGTAAELERMAPTYTGTSIEKKPPRMNRGEKLHRKVYEAVMAGRYITMEMAHREVAAWFDEYARREQPRSKYLAGHAPIELFERGRGPGIDPMALTYLMWAKKEVLIRASRIEAFGRYYYHDALYNRRHKAEIRYDLQDPSYIAVYENGEFICIAGEQGKVHPMACLGTDEDRARLSEYCEIKRHQEKVAGTLARQILESEVLPAHQRRMAYDGVTPQGPPAPAIEAPPKKLTAADTARIEAEVAAYEDQRPASLDVWGPLGAMPEVERYEQLTRLTARGLMIPKEHQAFMRYFEQTARHATLEKSGYWEQIRTAETILAQASAGQQ